MIEKGDIVITKGRPKPMGIVRKFYGEKVIVDWWPTSDQPQHTTFLPPNRLEILQKRERRGRPKKNDSEG